MTSLLFALPLTLVLLTSCATASRGETLPAPSQSGAVRAATESAEKANAFSCPADAEQALCELAMKIRPEMPDDWEVFVEKSTLRAVRSAVVWHRDMYADSPCAASEFDEPEDPEEPEEIGVYVGAGTILPAVAWQDAYDAVQEISLEMAKLEARMSFLCPGKTDDRFCPKKKRERDMVQRLADLEKQRDSVKNAKLARSNAHLGDHQSTILYSQDKTEVAVHISDEITFVEELVLTHLVPYALGVAPTFRHPVDTDVSMRTW